MGRCIYGIDAIRTLVAEFAGDADAIFPNCVLLETLKFQQNYLLVGLELSSSLSIYGTNKGGVLLVIGKYPRKLTISDSIQTPITHITGPNSLSTPAVVNIPTSKVSPLSFGAYGIPIPSGTPVSLYGFADATAHNDIFAICSLQLLA